MPDAEVERWFALQIESRSALAHAAEAARAALVKTVPALVADFERQYMDRLMRTHGASERLAAFIERREPQWRNA